MKFLGKISNLVGMALVLVTLLIFGILRTNEKRNHRAESASQKIAPNRPTANGIAQDNAKWTEAYGNLPLSFDQNTGQTAREVKFLTHGAGFGLFLAADEAVLSLHRSTPANISPFNRAQYFRSLRELRLTQRMTALRMSLNGANAAPQIAGVDQLPTKVNYFIGNDPKNWRTDVPSFAKVKYTGVYPGVDLVYYGNRKQLEYDFIVAPGTDPKIIELSLAGAKKLRIDNNGNLILKLDGGQLAFQKPVIYQNFSGERREIAGNYALSGNHEVKFAVANYDHSQPLVIDPVLNYSTYLGGSSTGDAGAGIAVDSSGDAFVTGTTFATAFPTTASGYNPGPLGSNTVGAVFVTEINPTGTAELYSTYLAGTNGDIGLGIALDSTGKIYVTGETFSTDFPTTASALKQGPNPGATNGTSFISKIDPTLNGAGSLVYSSYLGGTNGTLSDFGIGIAVDLTGNAYVVGFTSSSPATTTPFPLPNFPITTANAFQPAIGNSNGNAFLSRIDTTKAGASSLIYSTYLGGNGADFASTGFGDEALAVAVDSASNAYITGVTTSTNFPTSTGGLKTAAPLAVAKGTAFVTRIDTTKTGSNSLIYSTYLGSADATANDSGTAIALGPSNVAYVTGTTTSTNTFPIFPLAGAYQTTGSGGSAFVTLIDTTMSGNASLKYSTYLGSSGTTGFGIKADSTGNAYVGGGTSSSSFPVTKGAFQPTLAASAAGDGFIFKLSPSGNGTADLLYSTYFGGTGANPLNDGIQGIAIDLVATPPNVYVTGTTYSSNLPVFPTATAFQKTLGAGNSSSAFVAKLTPIPTLGITPSPATLAFGTQTIGVTTAAQTVTLTNNTSTAISFTSAVISGGSPAAANTDYVKSATTCGATIVVGTPCTISVTFDPSVTGLETANLVITDGDSSSPQTFTLSGTGAVGVPNFTVTAPGTLTVAQGATGNFTVTVGSVNAFNSAVALTCTGAPVGSTCTLVPTSVTPAANGTATSQATVVTHAVLVPPASKPITPASVRKMIPLFMAALLLFMLPAAGRTRLRLRVVAMMVLFIALVGCAGTTPTPMGTTSLTITGTSGSTTHTATVSFTVN